MSDQLEISIIADSALQAKFTSSPDELPRTLPIAFNIAEGIFDTQRVLSGALASRRVRIQCAA